MAIDVDALAAQITPTPEESAAWLKEDCDMLNDIFVKHMGNFPPVPNVVWEEMIAATVDAATRRFKQKNV